jgi:transposase
MSKPRLSVGIDVGKDELVVAVEGQSILRFGTTAADLKRLCRRLRQMASGRPLHIGMEATGVYSTRVAAVLAQAPGSIVSVINPAQVVAHGRALLRRTKTDAVDALVILDFVLKHTPPAWSLPSVSHRQLYALVVQADAIKTELRQWRNRQHAQSYALELPSEVAKSTKAMLALLQQQLLRIEQAIERLCRQDTTLADDMAILTSVKGIGAASAAQILAHGGEALTCRTRRQLDAHAGLAPAHRQSGTSVRGKSHLAKQGNARLRRALYMPALVAAHCNPHFQRHYQQLVARGKAKKAALVACMRKMLNLIRALLIKREPFKLTYQPLT